ncbi:UbiA family prenyltransferase [Fundicoccus sp. Sow4_D5]|uniref:UbiA family prenyltransferase n=1 Tax=unclassified Fundicoccus TaxID=2761543 RepID=UPI003F8F6D28
MNNKNLTIFLEFVEIRTKIASIFPMIIGFLWTAYHYQQFNWLNSFIFAIAVISFDMCTTAINNTIDFHKAIDLEYKNQENVIGKNNLSLKKMVYIVLALLLFAFAFAISLVFLTDFLLLILGGLCFLLGIIYTFGPTPISRSPYGEVMSGVTMGFGIFFLAIYMTMYESILSSVHTVGNIMINFNWFETVKIFMMSIPLICFIANIMLANNTRDLETDVVNERKTLVYFIGKRNAVILYQILSIIPWLVWLLYIISGILPVWASLGLSVIPIQYKSVLRYKEKQTRETFPESIKSFTLFASMYLIILLIANVIQFFS